VVALDTASAGVTFLDQVVALEAGRLGPTRFAEIRIYMFSIEFLTMNRKLDYSRPRIRAQGISAHCYGM
jgi:hypothetical protein